LSCILKHTQRDYSTKTVSSVDVLTESAPPVIDYTSRFGGGATTLDVIVPAENASNGLNYGPNA
jgi:hypothetical protein